jgi:hypothetical protein
MYRHWTKTLLRFGQNTDEKKTFLRTVVNSWAVFENLEAFIDFISILDFYISIFTYHSFSRKKLAIYVNRTATPLRVSGA